MLLLAGGLLGGCAGPVETPPEGRTLLAQAKDAYQRGEDLAAIDALDDFIDRYPSTDLADQALYYRARAQYRRDRYPQAASDARRVIYLTRRDELAAAAAVLLGDIAAHNDQRIEAIDHYTRALELLPSDARPRDYALYRRGVTFQHLGRWDEADLDFDRLVHTFPDSPAAALVNRRVRSTAWTLRLGAHSEPAPADADAARYRRQGLPVQVRMTRFGGPPVFVIEYGRYASHADARTAQAKLSAAAPDAAVALTR